MPASLLSRRGRKPSIGIANEKVHDVRRTLKTLVTELGRVEARLSELDRYYTRLAAEKAQVVVVERKVGSSPRGRGANVRDVAFEVLKKKGKPLSIAELAPKVLKVKGGTAGDHFVQNLGAALMKDRRFRRVGRGVYGVR